MIVWPAVWYIVLWLNKCTYTVYIVYCTRILHFTYIIHCIVQCACDWSVFECFHFVLRFVIDHSLCFDGVLEPKWDTRKQKSVRYCRIYMYMYNLSLAWHKKYKYMYMYYINLLIAWGDCLLYMKNFAC